MKNALFFIKITDFTQKSLIIKVEEGWNLFFFCS